MVTTDLTKEELSDMSKLDIAYHILSSEKSGLKFSDLFEQICEYKNYTDEESEGIQLQFYMDLSTDGKFHMLYSDIWTIKEGKVKRESTTKESEAMQSTYCHECKSYLSPQTNEACHACHSLKCTCGACHCR